MGSKSDFPIMKEAIEILKSAKIDIEVDIVSAHRTPEKMFSYAKEAHKRGIKVIIAGAGGAAHLPGMIASISPLPVIGVPINSSDAKWSTSSDSSAEWFKKCRDSSYANFGKSRWRNTKKNTWF